MPKVQQPRTRSDGWRPGPYGSWVPRFPPTSEGRFLPGFGRQPSTSLKPFEIPSGSFVNPFQVPLQQSFPATAPATATAAAYDNVQPAPNAGKNPQDNGPPPQLFRESLLKPTRQDKSKRDLTMVDSMLLQSVSRHTPSGCGRIPGLSIHSNSRGGGVQFNVFTKVPNLSKTIAFNVKSEEALLAAYRHVKAMNPSAAVGGVMFSVAPKYDGPVEVANVPWSNLTSRGGGPRKSPSNSYRPSRYRGY
ncbi:hypothetical protein NW762_008841 [Fusarium torreyae]|uniref:Uncharacterized protein n=1 Tax=Fusarium torreyae TaxID=1237075 RepID=A0A9W8RW85_9HYPO|nr:hypothetical protein NW762_008841 [Fusarium torreyae]